jgi:hypothetical protein
MIESAEKQSLTKLLARKKKKKATTKCEQCIVIQKHKSIQPMASQ